MTRTIKMTCTYIIYFHLKTFLATEIRENNDIDAFAKVKHMLLNLCSHTLTKTSAPSTTNIMNQLVGTMPPRKNFYELLDIKFCSCTKGDKTLSKPCC